MKYLSTIFFLLLLFAVKTKAVPAYPQKVAVQLSDSSIIFIQLFGDEHQKWAETEDGYTIIQDSANNWCYASSTKEGFLKASHLKVTSKTKTQEVYQFIQHTGKHLKPKSAQRNIKASHSETAAIGQRRMLIVLMEYQDLSFTKTAQDFYNLFNLENYHTDGAQGSVKDYYTAVSYGQLQLESDIYGPYRSQNVMAFYGRNSVQGNDINPFKLFEEAIQNVSRETDLSQYDSDSDGFIDNVHIIYAGYGEEAGAASTAIWAHESTFGKVYEIQNMKIDHYSCAPELRGNSGKGISRIGPHCHEIGHALGAMDYYDTDYDIGGGFAGTGKWDVMAQGSWNNDGITPADFNPYVKCFNYHWSSPKSMKEGENTVASSDSSPNNYYILGSTEQDDYYLLENRSNTGWGRGLPGYGLLLYHIHPDIESVRNSINVTAPQLCYIVCASSRDERPTTSPNSYGDINSSGCPFPGSSINTAFNNNSTPKAFFWNSPECGIDIHNIRYQDNGDIYFFNASKDCDFLPTEKRIVYFEDFEDNLKIKQYQGWELTVNPENNSSFLSQPLAYSGSHSFQINAYQEYFENKEGLLEFECDSILPKGEITISGYYTSFNTRVVTNKIWVGYKRIDSEEWNFEEINSDKNITWQQFEITLPKDVLPKFCIKGTAASQTILALDDIKVSQVIEKGDIMHQDVLFKSKMVNDHPKIYSLSGMQLTKERTKELNVIKKTDGNYIKKLFK